MNPVLFHCYFDALWHSAVLPVSGMAYGISSSPNETSWNRRYRFSQDISPGFWKTIRAISRIRGYYGTIVQVTLKMSSDFKLVIPMLTAYTQFFRISSTVRAATDVRCCQTMLVFWVQHGLMCSGVWQCYGEVEVFIAVRVRVPTS